MTGMKRDFERIRADWKPRKVTVLLVGESRPAQGTFFYTGDSSLSTITRDIFADLTKQEFESDDDFLSAFKKAGFYLDDLCDKPVNSLAPELRKQRNRRRVDSLSERIMNYKPRAIICVMKGIDKDVREAIAKSGVSLKSGYYCLPFPSFGHQKKYGRELEEALKDIGLPGEQGE